MTGWPRPGRPLSPIAVGAAILGTWWLVAHNSGSGWVQAIGDVVFGVLLIGLIGPAVVVARARVRIMAAPVDATAGLPVELTIGVSSRVRLRSIEPHGPKGFVGPVRGRTSTDASLTLVPEHRGVYNRISVEIATAAPFGLQWWVRRTSLPLPSTLHVAPRLGRAMPVEFHDRDRVGDSAPRAPDSTGDPRGVRPYRSGDNRRFVHWPATAHTGELMVRELERPMAEPVTVTVTLPPDADEAERLSERSLGTIVLLLDRGVPVLLGTTEASGPLVAPVEDRRRAGRRLARAVSGRSQLSPTGKQFGVEVTV
jgi:uncharacterized protein (DUF58 family)